jgi:hypothetical protein
MGRRTGSPAQGGWVMVFGRVVVGALFSTGIMLIPLPTEAQTPVPTSDLVEVVLQDGSHIVGYVVSDDRTSLVLKTVAGADVIVPRDRVRSIASVAGTIVDGEFRRDDALASKLFLGPTGRSLRRGEGYFAIDSVLLPVFQVGITDRLSFGVGKPFWVFTPAFWVTPKVQLYRGESTTVATGVLHLVVPDFGVGGVGYVVATRGTRDDAVTIGGGWLYGRDADGEDAGGAALLIIGGEHRTGRRSKVVTENYVFRDGAIATVGGRFIGETFSFEAGVIVPIAGGSSFPGPFFNFIWHSRSGGAVRK